MQIKTTSYCFTAVRMAVIEKTENDGGQECGRVGALIDGRGERERSTDSGEQFGRFSES